ncbi:unnamed protein product [Arabidopsis halleri]
MVFFNFPCLLLLTLFSSYGYAAITTSSPLSLRQILSSPNDFFELGFFSPNSSQNHQYVGIWFKRITPRVYVWVANREKLAVFPLTISSNGSLILLDEKQDIVWSSGREVLTSNECRAELLNSGNLVLIDNVTGKYLWESFEHPGDTMLPLSSLSELTPQVPPQGLVWKGSSPYWRSGHGRTQGVLTFCALRNFDVSYIKLTSDGSLDIHCSNGGTTGWIKHFQGPLSSCDLYGTCGPYGLCMRSISTPTCKCLRGFVPKSDDEWNNGNWTRGLRILTNYQALVIQNNAIKDVSATVLAWPLLILIKLDAWCGTMSYWTWFSLLRKESFFPSVLQLSFLVVLLARGKRIKIIAVSAISLCVFFILVLAAFGCWRYRVKQNGEARVAMDISEDSWKNGLQSHDVSSSNFFEMHTIQTATDNFSVSNQLGQGGFGTVYKGKLKDGKEIAIKRLSNSSGEGTEEFMNELKLISKLQHRNLVRLLGYCIEGEEKLLIYEFMVNKSLETFLFGIARGLLYLHHDSFLRVVHRDLKASNILLDEKMNPKISDFGLARKFQGTQNQDNSDREFGTLGYMSPEYAWTGTYSEKSDMYSFGVLMLEIVSGKEISSFSHGKEEKNLVAYIGLLCVQHQAMDRPNIKQVVSMLTSTMDLPKPEQPMFVSDTSEEDEFSVS